MAAFTRQHIEGTAGGAVVHGFHSDSLVNQALNEFGGWKSDAFTTAKKDQLGAEGQKFVKRRLGEIFEALGRPFLGSFNRAQKQGADLGYSVDDHAFIAVTLNGVCVAGIGMEFHALVFLKNGQFCGQIIGFPKRQHPSEGF